MAHFAELDENNVVLRVVVIDNRDILNHNNEESEEVGINFCKNLFGGGNWIQTSYNGNFRKNFPGIGYIYREDLDAFVQPKPKHILENILNQSLDFFVFDEETCRWKETENSYLCLKQSILQKYTNEIFVETGTYAGNGIQTALDCGFTKIYSIESDEKFAEMARNRFSKEIEENKVEIIIGDSAQVLPEVLNKIDKPATFWFDAHFETRGSEHEADINEIEIVTRCPILFELEALKNHPIKNHKILIDDITVFNGFRKSLGYESAWGKDITEQQIIDKILSINSEYEITYDAGFVPNDILVATVS